MLALEIKSTRIRVPNYKKIELGNTILRKIFDHFKYEIVKMDCVTIGPLTKKDLPRGHWKHLSDQEVSNLMML